MSSSAPVYELYQRLPGLVLGFHGCDEEVGEALLCGRAKHLKQSANDYDWLGSGIYFWENDPQRGWEFAHDATLKKHLTKGVVKKPFVIGAVIDLGLCLNLLDRKGLDEVQAAFETLDGFNQMLSDPTPVNKGIDLGQRFLDCAVIETLHTTRDWLNKQKNTLDQYPPYDSVRAAFPEEEPLYANAGFRKKNHVQIAVRSLSCIKGYFRPIEAT